MKTGIKGEEVYECSRCKRRVRIPVNIYGLTTLTKCTITNNCNGQLVKITNISEQLSTPVNTPAISGVQDWYARRLLYNHSQTYKSNKWTINHNLNNNPKFDVVVLSNNDHIPTSDYTINVINANTTELIFSSECIGYAQAISLSTDRSLINLETITTTDDWTPISNNESLIVIGTPVQLNNDATIKILFKSRTDSIIALDYTPSSHTKSAWGTANMVYALQTPYYLYGINVVKNAQTITYFRTGDIPTVTSCIIEGIYNNLEKIDTFIILLSKEPHLLPDKNINEVLMYDYKIFESNFTNQIISLDNESLYVKKSLFNEAYPPVKIIN